MYDLCTKVQMYDLCTKVQMYDLRFEFLVDHGADEVIEAEIVLLPTGFVQRGLRIGCAFELGFKTTAVVFQEFALLIRSCIRKFIGIDECRGKLSGLTKMLQMCEFVAQRRVLFVVPLIALNIGLHPTFFGEHTVRAMQMFLARNEFVVAVQGSFGELNAR